MYTPHNVAIIEVTVILHSILSISKEKVVLEKSSNS